MKVTDTAIWASAALGSILMLGLLLSGGAAAADIGELTTECANCHGKDGASNEPTVPIIGGISEFYMIDTLAVYQEEARPCVEAEYLEGSNKGSKTDMCQIAKKLGEADIEALAKFYAGKPFVRAKQDFDAQKAATGQEIHERNCEKCHGDGGASAEDDAGVLAGQWMHYLEESFKAYSAGEREMPEKMKPKYEKLEASEIDALIHYYASQQ